MSYHIQDFLHILRNIVIKHHILNNDPIKYLLFDSRLLTHPSSSVFFAFVSPQNDGHDYIPDLYKKGVRSFIIQKAINITLYPNANFLQVVNTTTALQNIATHHRQRFDIPILGITGSNGKTIVKEWLFQLLAPFHQIVRSPKSYNSQIGVPMSLWQINSSNELGIFEAGISKVDEMVKLQSMIQPSIGLITNIGDAHNTGFTSMKEKIAEKLILFKSVETLIYCKDHRSLHQQIKTTYPDKHTFTWGQQSNSDLWIRQIQKQEYTTIITGKYQGEVLQITIPFVDDAAIENAIHCWAVVLYLKIDTSKIKFETLTPVALRLELKAGINNCTLINDSYSADLNSLIIALNFLQQQNTHPHLTLILSDILQTGQSPTILYQTIADLIIEKGITKLIGVGSSIQQIKTYLPEDIKTAFYKSTTQFLKQLQSTTFQNESILLKGARKFEFEQISHRLVRKVHKTVLEINLNAVKHNLNVYRNLLRPTTKMMAMVKASAYGSGSAEVAKLLEFQKIDYLAVAYVDEAYELRMQGIQTPILVLNPEERSFDTCLRYHIEPEIYSLSILKRFIKKIKHSSEQIDLPFPIHLKLDTGMHRLGFEQEDIIPLAHCLKKYQHLVNVRSIFSHLAATDNPLHDDFTEQQVASYQKMYATLTKILDYQPIRHILNSSGIVRFKSHQMDMVRLGIGLYGIDSSQEMQEQLENVSTLKATISQIKTVKHTDTVGYDRSGALQQTTRTATISIGYADGLSRSLSKGQGTVWIKGKAAPILGNVCMDMCMINIDHIPEAKEGDEVIIFGKERSIEELAKQMNTIPYEILTNISERVKRVYFQE